MAHYTKEDIIRMVEEEDVAFIRLQFTDIFGTMKNLAVTAEQLEMVLDNQCLFDGSSIQGFVRIEESDMFLYPDPDTFMIFPWRPQRGKVARMICDIYTPDGKPFSGDSRYILKRAVGHAKEMGFAMQVGPECEFFLFQTDDSAQPTTYTSEQAGYFDLGPVDFGENARRDMVLLLEEMGYQVEASHHETSPAQHEIDMHYADALETADAVMSFKLAVKTIAKQHGLHASFMPKPKTGADGSGMHINISLFRDGVNCFADPQGENGLSREARWFIGGLMAHIDAMCAVLNPLVNSYKRLVDGYDAPLYVAWSARTRSPLIRIPYAKDPSSTRIELRSPDCAANPYLALALCLEAGLDGIRNQIEPPEAVNTNLYQLSEEEKKALGIRKLPLNLMQAIECLKEDTFVQNVLGPHITGTIIQAKEEEWGRYSTQVSEWEVKEYLNRI